MTKNLILAAIICFLMVTKIFAQADCIIWFKYKGSILSDSLKIEKIGLPTTPFLCGYIKETDREAFDLLELKDSVINDTCYSHLSSDFCLEYNYMLNRVFRKDNKGYPIEIFCSNTKDIAKRKMIELTLPIDKITFSPGNKESKLKIIIDLGRIII